MQCEPTSASGSEGNGPDGSTSQGRVSVSVTEDSHDPIEAEQDVCYE